MKNLVLEAESVCTNLEDSIKRARCIADTMFNEFYSLREVNSVTDSQQILHGYRHACIEHDIINDYLVKMNNDIDALTKIIDKMPADAAYAKAGDPDAT